MRGNDLDFAHRLSLAQRNLDAATLMMESAQEFFRDTVNYIQRVQSMGMQHAQLPNGNGEVLTAEFIDSPLRKPHKRMGRPPKTSRPALAEMYGNGHNAAPNYDEPEPEERVKPKRQFSPEALQRMREAAAHARASRMKQLGKSPAPTGKAQKLLAAPTPAVDPDEILPKGLKPIDGKSQSDFGGLFAYPYFLREYLKKYPKKHFTADDVTQFARSLGYGALRKKVSSALSHQTTTGAIKTITPTRGAGYPAVYAMADIAKVRSMGQGVGIRRWGNG